MVYTNSRIFNVMDGYDNGDVMSDICAWCNIERDELYMGGGLYVYKCPKCGGRMEVKQ